MKSFLREQLSSKKISPTKLTYKKCLKGVFVRWKYILRSKETVSKGIKFTNSNNSNVINM